MMDDSPGARNDWRSVSAEHRAERGGRRGLSSSIQGRALTGGSRRQFIRLCAAIGLGAAGTSVMAACGSNAGSTERGSGTGANLASERTTGGGSKVGKGQPIAKVSEVATNEALRFTDASTGEPAVLLHLKSGSFVAYSAVCTHQGCTVGYRPEMQMLVCPCHGGVFDPAGNASVQAGPPPTPLPELKVEARNGDVFRI
jgi:Rieske Fe-S protein